MPVFASKASSTFWKFSCSAPPHSDVTVIVPPAVAPEAPGSVLAPVSADAGATDEPVPVPDAAGPGVAPPLQAPTMSAAAIGRVRKRGNLAIGPPPCTDEDAGRAGVRSTSPLERPSDGFPLIVGKLPGVAGSRSTVRVDHPPLTTFRGRIRGAQGPDPDAEGGRETRDTASPCAGSSIRRPRLPACSPDCQRYRC